MIFLMEHQNLTHVTNFSDIFLSLKLVTPSLNYTPNVVFECRDSKLVTLMCTREKKTILSRF